MEELADCLVRMIKAIQSETNHEEKICHIRSALKEDVSPRIQPFTVRLPEAVGLSNRARFTFMDIFEGIQKFSS